MLPIILFVPLSLFTPKLIGTKTWAIQKFGNTIRKHNLAYRKAWIDGNGKKGETLLGTKDNSSLADINGSYASVEGMQVIPVNRKMILMSFALNLIPYLPLIFTYYSVPELFNDFLKGIMGTY